MGCYIPLQAHGGLKAILPQYYPQHPWQIEHFLPHTKARSSQRWLRRLVSELLFNTGKGLALWSLTCHRNHRGSTSP